MKKILTLVFVMVFTLVAMSQSKWQEQTSGTTSILRCVRALSNNLAWVSGYDAGEVLVTSNGGTNWVLKTSPNATFANFTMTALDANT
ncbi:MAG: hypothetical protein N3A61_05255, partial [Ignavibacteria bacterium]|nr:hypothetical protein [Ignavibacteria bacterium]